MKALVAMLLVLVVGGCAHRHAAPPAEMSGFLDDYALLREGGPNDSALVYRAPDANWSAYDKVLLEPVTLWRSGRKSLEPVPQEDLLRLVTDFQSAVRKGLGEGFRVVDQAGPGVMRIRLAITDAGSGVDPSTLAATVDGRRRTIRYSLRTHRATVGIAGLRRGAHSLVVVASDFQEAKNMEDVAGVLPNTRRYQVTIVVR